MLEDFFVPLRAFFAPYAPYPLYIGSFILVACAIVILWRLYVDVPMWLKKIWPDERFDWTLALAVNLGGILYLLMIASHVFPKGFLR